MRKLTFPGKVRLRSIWSDDGKVLVTNTEFTSKDGPGSIITSLFLQGNDTMVHLIKLKLKDGAMVTPAKRIFKKKKN
jgi:hypothetical protein